MLESDRPFFSRARTKHGLDQIEQCAVEADRLLIYGGAGVTIDRSNLDWRGLIDGLLRQYVSDSEARSDIFGAASILEVASLAIEYFYKDYGPDYYRERITDRLRVMLYSPGDWRAGALAENIATLAMSLSARNIGFLLATPNYDDYIAAALSSHIGDSPTIVTSVAKGQEQGLIDGTAEIAEWIQDPNLTKEIFDDRSAVLQLHGLIPRSRSVNNGVVIPPVIGELDYFASERYTLEALVALLTDTPALFVGTSLTDRPLLQALARTKSSKYPRFAIVPVGIDHEKDRVRQRAIRASMLERFQHFGVTPIYVDYYFQVAQFVDELARTVRVRDERPSREQPLSSDDVPVDAPTTADSSPTETTYGSRLIQWSSDWLTLQAAEPDAEDVTSMLTDFALEQVREILDVSDSEITKLELWVRDNPVNFRGLRLYKSSVSQHFQEESARRAAFSNASRIAAVKAFVIGRPVVTPISREASPNQRWRTYLSLPVRLRDERGIYGHLPVGAIVLASMRDSETAGIVRPRRRNAMHEATETLVWLGELLTDTDPEMWRLEVISEADYGSDGEVTVEPDVRDAGDSLFDN